SGTNEIHGSLFDFQRSNSNFAKNPYTGAVPSGNWNQFGAAIGAPIIKNKLFLFGDYQGQRSHVGGSFKSRVPTSDERNGDLSDLGINIFDPCTDTGGTFHPACDVAPGSRKQFTGNVIPTGRLSPQAQDLLALIPLPNTSGPTATSDNFIGAGNNT